MLAVLSTSHEAVFSPLIARIFDCHDALQVVGSIIGIIRANVLLLVDELSFPRFFFDLLGLIYWRKYQS